MDDRETLVYDFDLKRPACVLLQAVFGCGASPRALHFFEPEDWLVAPTPGMQKVAGTLTEWKRVAEITVAARATRKEQA